MVTAAVAMGLGVQADAEAQDESTIVERLSRVNREVFLRCKTNAHMTMTAVLLDLSTGELMIHGLGGLPALLMDRDGKHTVLGSRGTPLGSGEDLQVGERTAHLAPGDRLLLMTDGIVETMLPNGRPFGMRQFVKVMRDARTLPLSQAVKQMVHVVDTARGGESQEDDFTFCVLERTA
jgi:sigma-B regulation protein RsbU (phosphoserine phosphatase)